MLRRLRAGEALALLGSALIVASLFTNAYSTPVGNVSAWETFGPAVALQIAALFAGLAMVVAALTERDSTAAAVATSVWCTLLAFVALVASVVRILERPDHATGLCAGPWLALAGCAAVLVGGWVSMRDERRSLYPALRAADAASAGALRADEVRPSLEREVALSQAPASDGEGFLVPSPQA